MTIDYDALEAEAKKRTVRCERIFNRMKATGQDTAVIDAEWDRRNKVLCYICDRWQRRDDLTETVLVADLVLITEVPE